MIHINFICHGNICRSPMAEFVMRDLVKKQRLESEFYIVSSATSSEEIGNPVHPGTKRKLKEHGIDCFGKYAVQFKKSDYDKFDYLVVMDSNNIRNLNRIIKSDTDNKVYKLLDFTSRKGDISDPWYTGNFDETYRDVYDGCTAFLDYLIKKHFD